MNRSIVSVLAAALGLAAAPAFAQSAAFPSRPVRIMVGFAPGGSVDLVARALSQRLSVIWGRQVVVENRPGAASHIAGLAVSRAEPDGHTLLVTSMGALGTNLALYRTMPYNPLKDLSPLALLVSQNLVLIVNPALPVKTVRDYISLAKARPGEVTYGSAGSGGPLHLSAEMFAHRVGVRPGPPDRCAAGLAGVREPRVRDASVDQCDADRFAREREHDGGADSATERFGAGC